MYKANKDVVTELSTKVALANRPCFRAKLNENLSAEELGHIREVDPKKGEEPHIDVYGRVTYFYTQLSNRKIWLYQPGTIMFESGVGPSGDLAVHHGGSQSEEDEQLVN